MKSLTEHKYQELTGDANVLISSPSGEAMVMELPNNVILKKLAKEKKLRAKFYPRSKRFQRNCMRLDKIGITVPNVIDLYDFSAFKCDVIIYSMVDGIELIEKLLIANDSDKQRIMRDVAQLYGKLNNNGIYCSPMHFRNILVDDKLSLGLIDVQNIGFRPWRLGLQERARNFRRIFKYDEHIAQVISYGAEQFFNDYMDYCQFNPQKKAQFVRCLTDNTPMFFNQDSGKFIS